MFHLAMMTHIFTEIAWWSSWGIWRWCSSAWEWSSKVKVFPYGN